MEKDDQLFDSIREFVKSEISTPNKLFADFNMKFKKLSEPKVKTKQN